MGPLADAGEVAACVVACRTGQGHGAEVLGANDTLGWGFLSGLIMVSCLTLSLLGTLNVLVRSKLNKVPVLLTVVYSLLAVTLLFLHVASANHFHKSGVLSWLL